MADDTFYMKQALAEAQKAFDRGEVPVGAVVVKDITECGTYVGVPAGRLYE